MKYDGVIELAKLLENGSKPSMEILNLVIRELDNEGLIDVMETIREVLYDNTGDEELTRMMLRFMELIQAEQSTRITQNLFSKVGKFFKK